MNIDKQDERLLHEILSKYKQGIISGLYPGTNITFTPTGCRDKIISSIGEGGDFDLFNETISYPLGDPINLTGDEVFFIAGAEGLTLSLTQLSTAILSQVTNTGGAFLEKEQVNTSRSFQSSDKNKILYIGSDTRLTVAEGITFADGDIIGVSYSIDSPDNRSGFNIVPDGHLIFPYCSIDSVSNEVVYLSALNIEGQTVLIPISTFIKISDAINNEAKTALRYLYDQSQNAIPLSGTEVGSPVTGNIEIENNQALFSYGSDNIVYGSFGVEDDKLLITYNSNNISQIKIDENGFTLDASSPISKGLKSSNDYSTNNDGSDRTIYTQTGWVIDYVQNILGYRGTATLSSGTVTVNTDKIKTGYKIYLSVNTPSGTQGFLSAPTGSIVDETEFVINSTSATDDSTVNWWIAP